HELRYVNAWGRWLSFDGSRWADDTTLHTFDRVRAICREIAFVGDKPARAVASAKTVVAVERLARADRRFAATAEQWDDSVRKPKAMATFDLHTGAGHKPNPLDYITKQTACRCAPVNTPHPLWDKFLERVTNHNKELQAFLQRWCGYCCTGFTSEHVFVFA